MFADLIVKLIEQEGQAEDEVLERLAALEHDQWSGWMKYMFSKCTEEDGKTIIPAELVERWKRQMETPYDELPEEEKESDRVEARKVLAIVKADVI